VAAVFAQMGGDAVGSGGLAQLSRHHRIRFPLGETSITGFPQRGHMVNIDT
jgi:hypothetical protein